MPSFDYANNARDIQQFHDEIANANKLRIQAQKSLNEAEAKLKLAKYNCNQHQVSELNENFNTALDRLKARKNQFLSSQQIILDDLIKQSKALVKESDHQRIKQLTLIINAISDILDHKPIDNDALALLNNEKNQYSFFDKKRNRVLVGIACALIGLLILAAFMTAFIFTSTLVPGNPGILLPFMLLEACVAAVASYALYDVTVNQFSIFSHKPHSLANVLNDFSENFKDVTPTDNQSNTAEMTF